MQLHKQVKILNTEGKGDVSEYKKILDFFFRFFQRLPFFEPKPP